MTHAWWSEIAHGGMLIAPAKLPAYFPDELPPLGYTVAETLRADVTRAMDDPQSGIAPLLDTVLERVLHLETSRWLKASDVGKEWSHPALTGEIVRPRRLWLDGDGSVVLPVFVADDRSTTGSAGLVNRLGVGRGRRPVSRVTRWLRQANEPIALLTNGRQWRLIAVGGDWAAWCEWDIDLWFEEGRPGPQVTALRALLGRASLSPAADDRAAPLVAAIQASRRGQGELSSVLGERVRQAVETLITAFGADLDAIDGGRDGDVPRTAIYTAATRIVMRCVVVSFAEARGDELLPRANPQYFGSYSLQGLREELDRMAGGRGAERLRYQHGAWPRLLALFRLIHDGSPHPDLPVPAYGGALFEPGRADSIDPISRALALLENPRIGPDDAVIHRVLTLLSRSKVRVRQRHASTWIDAPVDFSDLSTEYIGILYEGLLDFELRRAPSHDPIVFLNVGDQPALPLARLEAMDDKSLRRLLERLGKVGRRAPSGDDADEESDQDANDVEDEESEAETASDELDYDGDEDGDAVADTGDDDRAAVADDDSHAGSADDLLRAGHDRVTAWALRAVDAAGLVVKPRGKRSTARQVEHEAQVAAMARQLVARVVLPDAWYLVRWGGTRKGAGTFYTRPQLAGPTAQRTLRPMAYEAVDAVTDIDTGLERVTSWRPRTPETILDLKVCDPAMGSGSFLIAAVRFLTDALVESLHAHDRLRQSADGTTARLADGLPTTDLWDEPLPVAVDNPEFEDHLRARLKRYVVERCIYGVDIDPLAVELAKLSLWIDTMDRSLPFGFLDHKLKVGDSLVGCWFDRFQDYPALAWERDGGDSGHDRFVHHFHDVEVARGKNKGATKRRGDKWSHAIKTVRNDVIKHELVAWINAGRDDAFPFMRDGFPPDAVHDDALQALEAVHRLPAHDTEGRRSLYRETVEQNPEVRRLRDALDTWCAIWFWPGDELDHAPTPKTFADPPPETLAVVRRLAAQNHFFHWELEYPDVFAGENSGFDAVVGNPPWEIRKPNSKEFFSNHDPLYRAYGKQEALARQTEMFAADETVEVEWLRYAAQLKASSNWVRNAAYPWGDPKDEDGSRFAITRSTTENTALHRAWRHRRSSRSGYADAAHVFRHQGSADINTYKMFLEQAHALLRTGGRMGLIVPSGVYTDKGSTNLRELFLDHADWEWLFGFENRNAIFDIHRSFKFGPLIVRKGGRTKTIRAAFMRHDLEDWEDAERHMVAYPRSRVTRFSPRSRSLLEIRDRRDLEILDKMYANGVLLGDDGPDGWGIKYAREFDMTNDSHLFPPRPWWEERGYRGDEYGHWLKGRWHPYDGPTGVASILVRPGGQVLSQDGNWAIDVDDIEDVALPLYEGRMIDQFDFSAKGWVSGKGRTAVWREIPWENKVIEPQYLMAAHSWVERLGNATDQPARTRLAYMDVSSATNQRTMIASAIGSNPCGNSAPLLQAIAQPAPHLAYLRLAAVLGSFAYDFQCRLRMGGLHLNYFVVEETALAAPSGLEALHGIDNAVASICLANVGFAPNWLTLDRTDRRWVHNWAVTLQQRLRLRVMLDAIVAELYGLDRHQLVQILRACDYPARESTTIGGTRAIDPKGFWRVDKTKPPELRHTVLSLVAFADLKAAIESAGGDREAGIAAFCSQNDGDGWMLPETLRLADYDLGHDDRAKVTQPVRSAMGDRFLPWQLEMSVEESWEACTRHAELIGRVVPWAGAEVDLGAAEVEGDLGRVAEEKAPYGDTDAQLPMFKEPS